MISNKMYCIGNSEVIKTCTDQRCTQVPLMCSNPRCKCSESHKLCKGVNQFQTLVLQLIEKINILKKPFQTVLGWYSNAVKQINFQKDQLLRKVSFLIEKLLDANQVKFLHALSEGKSWKITGDTMFKNMLSLKKSPTNIDILQEQVKQDLNKVNKDLQNNLSKIRKIWQAQNDDKQGLQILKKCGIKWTWLNGKWIKPVPQQFPLTDLTGIGLDYIDSNTIRSLAANCPKLQGLQVGYWVPDSNFDDTCAETVASNLPFLKRLWIYNSPLSDKGSAAVCVSLQSLQYLILNNCKLSQKGKSQVKRLLPECKKIQLL